MTFLGLYRASPLRPLVTVVLKFAASPIRTPALVLCGALLCASMPTPVRAQQWPSADADQTLKAMRDELERSRSRMEMPNLEKPYFIQYRLVDLDVRTITASFGALVSSSTAMCAWATINSTARILSPGTILKVSSARTAR
jgi:hypothetical protein